MDELLIRDLLALRAATSTALAQVDAMIARAETALAARAPALPPPPDGNSDARLCGHPPADRKDTTTAGAAPSWFCPHCRHTSDELRTINATTSMAVSPALEHRLRSEGKP